ncbi:hypothetical protein DITRI_Ditri12bG0151300 [Diplodiscus trichospermus]
MMVSSSCMGGPRRAMIGGIYGQEQRHHVRKGKAVEARRNRVEDSLNKNIDNHHNIPREKYNDWGSNSPDNGDSGDDGSG